jgi:hypothetical protein
MYLVIQTHVQVCHDAMQLWHMKYSICTARSLTSGAESGCGKREQHNGVQSGAHMGGPGSPAGMYLVIQTHVQVCHDAMQLWHMK